MDFIGRGSISNLKKNTIGTYLMFTTSNMLQRFGKVIFSEIEKEKGFIYDEITENPKIEDIKLAQNKLHTIQFDTLIAFGGGSVIDFAKAFRFYEEKQVKLIAIPTTAGTGSEATQFAVVYINDVKTSLDNPSILPEIVIADSQFVENAPRYLKACSSMDAYCQAIESFWALKANNQSKKYALQALKLCRDNIINAVNSNDMKANENMVRAANLSGKAINISRTTAAHALSYKITSEYAIPHGHAVALTFANLFEYNIQHVEDAEILCKSLGVNKENFKEYFNNLSADIGLELNFDKLGINNIVEIAQSVDPNRLKNNPVPLQFEDLIKILSK